MCVRLNDFITDLTVFQLGCGLDHAGVESRVCRIICRELTGSCRQSAIVFCGDRCHVSLCGIVRSFEVSEDLFGIFFDLFIGCLKLFILRFLRY